MRGLQAGRWLIWMSLAGLAAGCGDISIPGNTTRIGGEGGSGTSKSNPVITWATPAPITNPAPLSATQLDATANVAGSFAYTPASGTVLSPGNQTLSATFTPDDTADYNVVSATVMLVVNQPVNPCLPAVPTGGPSVQPGNGSWVAVSDTGNNRVLIYAAPVTTGENATIVLGQPDFTHNGVNQGCSAAANTLYAPAGLAIDSAGNLYVSDADNCRVLQFRPPFTTDMSASVVFGQAGLDDSGMGTCEPTPAAGARQVIFPDSLATDAAGDLWIADSGASRITEYVPPFSNGMAASVSIGQTNLNNTWECNGAMYVEGAPTARTLCKPYGLMFDGAGDLWVSDTNNQRELEFVPPFSTGMAASLELGQTPGPNAFNATTSENCDTVNPMVTTPVCGPWGVAFDRSGDLWIGSFPPSPSAPGSTLLEFSPPFSNGMQGVATTPPTWIGALPTANTVRLATALSVDREGDLFAADSGFSRVVMFVPPQGAGMSATVVLGEPDMTTTGVCDNGQPTANNTVCSPWGVLAF